MFASAEVKSWQEKKHQLLVESEINRCVLALEWTQLKASLNWTKTVVQKLKSPRPAWLLLVLAPLAGFLVTKRFRRRGGWLNKAFFLWRITRRILPLWQILKRPTPTP